jgi:hypothetical protein
MKELRGLTEIGDSDIKPLIDMMGMACRSNPVHHTLHLRTGRSQKAPHQQSDESKERDVSENAGDDAVDAGVFTGRGSSQK